MVLNPVLYQLLRQRFGAVRVANEGMSIAGKYLNDPISGRTVYEIDARGETYCVDCPFCNDTRQRLWINHMYGVRDEITNSDNLHLARCFNEDCLKKDPDKPLFKELSSRIFQLLNRDQRQAMQVAKGIEPITADIQLSTAPPPGEVVRLQDLPRDHKAISYLSSRGYNLDQLCNRWQLVYCTAAEKQYCLAQDRIIVPIIMNGTWVGWQARYVGDIDWKQNHIPKYYSLPSMAKRLMLYNHDTAKKQDIVMICEGPTSTWAVYPYGVGLLGKQATLQQQRLLINEYKDKTVIVLLDSDAKPEADRLKRQLQPYVTGKLVVIELPSGRDPGSYQSNQAELEELIRAQALEQGTELPTNLFYR